MKKKVLIFITIAALSVGSANIIAQSSGGGGGGGWSDDGPEGCTEGALLDCMLWLLFGIGDESACWLCSGGG